MLNVEFHYTVNQKLDIRLVSVTLPNANRFSKFFHWQTR